MIEVRIPSPLRSYTKDESVVSAEGKSLEQVLDHLDQDYPGIKFRMLDEQDRIRQHIKFFVNTTGATDLKTKIGTGDILHIICALSGG